MDETGSDPRTSHDPSRHPGREPLDRLPVLCVVALVVVLVLIFK